MLQVMQSVSLTILDNTQYLTLHKMPITLSIILLFKHAVNKNLDIKQEYHSVPLVNSMLP